MMDFWRDDEYDFCVSPILLVHDAPWSGGLFATLLRRMVGRWRFELLYLGAE